MSAGTEARIGGVSRSVPPEFVLTSSGRYVDNQLRHSRRFDADGIRRDHPELFIPTPQRRTSSSASISSLASPNGLKEEFSTEDSGQLRYWTSSMCIQSPHLFDFVVTVSAHCSMLAGHVC